jgi:hypothetical protein
VSERVNPLVNLDDFTIKSSEKKPKPTPEAIEKLAVENGFPSRQAQRAKDAEPVRKQRRYTRAMLDALADELQVPLGEVLARALAALRRELDAK